jgi:hypothetical protein
MDSRFKESPFKHALFGKSPFKHSLFGNSCDDFEPFELPNSFFSDSQDGEQQQEEEDDEDEEDEGDEEEEEKVLELFVLPRNWKILGGKANPIIVDPNGFKFPSITAVKTVLSNGYKSTPNHSYASYEYKEQRETRELDGYNVEWTRLTRLTRKEDSKKRPRDDESTLRASDSGRSNENAVVRTQQQPPPAKRPKPPPTQPEFDILWPQLVAVGWTSSLQKKQRYWFPPNVTKKAPFKNRKDYFDSKKQVLAKGPGLLASSSSSSSSSSSLPVVNPPNMHDDDDAKKRSSGGDGGDGGDAPATLLYTETITIRTPSIGITILEPDEKNEYCTIGYFYEHCSEGIRRFHSGSSIIALSGISTRFYSCAQVQTLASRVVKPFTITLQSKIKPCDGYTF